MTKFACFPGTLSFNAERQQMLVIKLYYTLHDNSGGGGGSLCWRIQMESNALGEILVNKWFGLWKKSFCSFHCCCGNRFHVVRTFTQVSSEPQIIWVPKDFCNCLGIGKCFHQFILSILWSFVMLYRPIHHIFYKTWTVKHKFLSPGLVCNGLQWKGEKNTIPLSLKKLGVFMEWHKP